MQHAINSPSHCQLVLGRNQMDVTCAMLCRLFQNDIDQLRNVVVIFQWQIHNGRRKTLGKGGL